MLFCIAATASANTFTWTGKAGNQNWSSVQNWSPSNSVPASSDIAIISGNVTVLVDQPVTVNGLQITNATLAGNSSLTVTLFMESQGALLQPAGGITMNGTMTIDPFNPSIQITTIGCPMTINGTGRVNPSGTLQLGAGIIVKSDGLFTLSDGAQLLASSGAQFINESSFNAGNSIFNGPGLFTNSAAGTVTVGSGTFQFLSGSIANNGTFTANGSAVINITIAMGMDSGASYTGTGTNVMSHSGTLDGSVSVTGNLQVGNSLTMNGNLNVLSGGKIIWVNGTFQGVGTNVTGQLAIRSGGDLVINQQSGLALQNMVLTNGGTITITNLGNIFMGYNARIDNTGTILVDSDGAFVHLSSGGPGYDIANFNNITFSQGKGFFTKRRGTPATSFTSFIPFFGGNVTVLEGNLVLNDGGSIEKVSTVTNATLQLNTGIFRTGLIGAQILGSGNTTGLCRVRGGAVLILDNSLLIYGALSLEGGSIVGTSPMECSSGAFFNWSAGTIALTNNFFPITIDAQGQMNITGPNNVKILRSGIINNFGTLTWTNDNSNGGVTFGNGTAIINGGTFNINCDSSFNDNATTSHPAITNLSGAVLTKSSSLGTSGIGFKLVNYGEVDADSGTLDLNLFDDVLPGITDILDLKGGTIKLDTPTQVHGKIQGHGKITVNGGLTSFGETSTKDGDVVQVEGNFTNNGTADIDPGTLSLLSFNYSQGPAGKLIIPIRGTNTTTLDFGRVIMASGSGNLDGALEVQIIEGYAPPVGTSFQFLTAPNGRNGTFANVLLPPGMMLSYSNNAAWLFVTGAVPVQVLSPQTVNGQFQFGFNTVTGRSYTVLYRDDLLTNNWLFLSNFTGNGLFWQISPQPTTPPRRFYRVSEP